MKQLQDMKIRIRDAEHSKQVQECLFKLGFGWSGYQKTLQFTDEPYMFAEESGTGITYASESDELYFSNEPSKEVTLEDLQAMLAPDEIPEGSSTTTVETTSVSVPTFSVDDTINTYISQIQKRLAGTNLSVSIYGDEIRVANMDNDDEVGVSGWEDMLEIIKVKQAYLSVFKGIEI